VRRNFAAAACPELRRAFSRAALVAYKFEPRKPSAYELPVPHPFRSVQRVGSADGAAGARNEFNSGAAMPNSELQTSARSHIGNSRRMCTYTKSGEGVGPRNATRLTHIASQFVRIEGMGLAIECRGLRKTYDGKVEALRGLDLEIREGECFGLLGPNGAGKTTAIEILEGLLSATSGEVRILGRTWQSHPRELREWLGISLQETRLAEKLTVRETIELFASFYRQPRSPLEVLAELELTEKSDAWVGKLSGGQRQRLAVATALVANPRILFLDEPTTGLDPQSRRQLWDIIREFQRAGGTVLLTTHYMDEAERLCDRLAIIDYGQIIAGGSPAELIERLGGQHMVEFAIDGASSHEAKKTTNGKHLQEVWRSLPGVESVHADNGLICLTVRQPHVTIPALLEAVSQQGARLLHLTTRQASLEDVFVRLTGRHLREES
jgi:ABC-2 type transport system ATP-binding protein